MISTPPDPEWKKGSAELLVLSLLEDQPRHGYDISKLIQIRSGGALQLPLKFCELFSICAIVRAAFHSTSKETFARTGKTPAMGGLGSPSPCVRELARSWSSKTFKSRTRKWARASSKSTSTASCLTGVIQNTSFRSTCTL